MGRMLVSKNEDLQLEIERLRGQETPRNGDFLHRSPLAPSDSEESPINRWRYRKKANRNQVADDAAKRADLAKEYEADLQDFVAENNRLKQDNRVLQEQVKEARIETESVVSTAVPSLRESLGSDRKRYSDDGKMFLLREQFEAELDTERSRSLELEKALSAEKWRNWELTRDASVTRAECREARESQGAKEEEIKILHERIEELAHAAQTRQFSTTTCPEPHLPADTCAGLVFGGDVRESVVVEGKIAELRRRLEVSELQFREERQVQSERIRRLNRALEAEKRSKRFFEAELRRTLVGIHASGTAARSFGSSALY